MERNLGSTAKRKHKTQYCKQSTLNESEFDIIDDNEIKSSPKDKNNSDECSRSDEGEFDLVDYTNEVRQANNKIQESMSREAFVQHAYDSEDPRDTYVLAKREYSLLETPLVVKENSKVDHEPDDAENSKQPRKTKWTQRFKQGFGNFVYKMNHNSDYFSQYGKIDYKCWDKKPVRLMLGHFFDRKNSRKQIEALYRNIILFTYRKHFRIPLESINKKSGKPIMLSSDFGWGCMIRWGQMMLANALIFHIKQMIFNTTNGGLDVSQISEENVYNTLENDVLSKFMDSQKGKDSPFSIHEITDQGLGTFHKVAGDWYGTNSISQVLKELNYKYKPYEDFEICVFNDGVIFKDEIINLGSELYKNKSFIFGNLAAELQEPESPNQDDYFEQTRMGLKQQSGGSDTKQSFEPRNKSEHSGGGSDSRPYHERIDMGTWSFNNENVFTYQDEVRKWNKSVLIIINTRLAIKKIPEETYTEITKMFQIPQMIGILGGKGQFGLYFVGHQKDSLILLDPHNNQETVSTEEEIKRNRDTYRWPHIRTIKIKKLDPWIGVGFIVRSYTDYQQLWGIIEQFNKSSNAIFGIQETKVKPDKDSIHYM